MKWAKKDWHLHCHIFSRGWILFPLTVKTHYVLCLIVPKFTFFLLQETQKINKREEGEEIRKIYECWFVSFIFCSSYWHSYFLLQNLGKGGIFAKRGPQSENNSSSPWYIWVRGLGYGVCVELKHTSVIMHDNMLVSQTCHRAGIFYFSEPRLPKPQTSTVINEHVLYLRHRFALTPEKQNKTQNPKQF